MAKRGRKLNQDLRQRVAALRGQGLTYAEIGRLFGVTKQWVGQLLRSAGLTAPLPPVRCRACGTPLAEAHLLVGHHHVALCLACLAEAPNATLAVRLLAHRLAAGLSQSEVGARAGVTKSAVSRYEAGAYQPRPRVLRRLAEVLGAGLLGGSEQRP
jgi:transcriptional regulator with XRE-family HTH domain